MTFPHLNLHSMHPLETLSVVLLLLPILLILTPLLLLYVPLVAVETPMAYLVKLYHRYVDHQPV